MYPGCRLRLQTDAVRADGRVEQQGRDRGKGRREGDWDADVKLSLVCGVMLLPFNYLLVTFILDENSRPYSLVFSF